MDIFKNCMQWNVLSFVIRNTLLDTYWFSDGQQTIICVYWGPLLLHVISFAIPGYKVQGKGDEVEIRDGLFAKYLERHKMILWRWSSGIKIFHCYYGFFCCVVIVLIANNAFEIIICIITVIMHLGFLSLFRAHVEISAILFDTTSCKARWLLTCFQIS